MNISFFLKPKVEVSYLTESCPVQKAMQDMLHSGFTAIPVVDAKGKYAGTITVCEVEIEESAVLAAEYAPEIVPTFVLFKDKKAISVMGGMVDEHTFESRMLEILS